MSLRLVSVRALALAVALPLLLPGAVPAAAGETRVAVAANFAPAAREIARVFERQRGHRAQLSFGATGQLFTQITQDAPFDVFLAADRERPARLFGEGLGAEPPFTYAVGRLALYSPEAERVQGPGTLRAARFERLAVANPRTAPYGAAALETLRGLGVDEALRARLVRGQNIAQTYQFVLTGNAELGFVALAQIAQHSEGSRWIVPAELHTPLRQDALLLARGAANEAARAFTVFLRGSEVREIIERYGYALAD